MRDTPVHGLTTFQLEEDQEFARVDGREQASLTLAGWDNLLKREFMVESVTLTFGTAADPFLFSTRRPWISTLLADLKPLVHGSQYYTFIRWKSVIFRFVTRTVPTCYGRVWAADNTGFWDKTSTSPPLHCLISTEALSFQLADQGGGELRVPWYYSTEWLRTLDAFDDSEDATDFRYLWSSWKADPDADTPTMDIYARFEGLEFSHPRNFLVPDPVMNARPQMDARTTQIGATLGVLATLHSAFKMSRVALNEGQKVVEEAKGLYNDVMGQPSEDRPPATKDSIIPGGTVSIPRTRKQDPTQGNFRNFPIAFDDTCTIGSSTPIALKDLPDLTLVEGSRHGDTRSVHFIHHMVREPQLEIFEVFDAPGEMYIFPLGPFPKASCLDDIFGHKDRNYSFGNMAYLSQMFNYYRGSIEICLWSSVSAFQTAEIEVYINAGPYLPYAVTGSTDGNCFKQVISVKGDTFASFDVPHWTNANWRPCTELESMTNTADIPVIKILLKTLKTSLGSTSPVPLCVWIRAGKDFEFNVLRDPTVWNREVEPPTNMTPEMFQGPVRLFDQPYLQQLGTITTVEEMIRKWSRQHRTSPDAFLPDWQPNMESTISYLTTREIWDLVLVMFVYFSGRIQYRIMTAAATCMTKTPMLPEGNNYTFTKQLGPNGSCIMPTPTLASVYDFEHDPEPTLSVIPIHDSSWWTDHINYHSIVYHAEKVGENHELWRRAGENFQLIKRRPLVEYKYWPASSYIANFTPTLKETPSRSVRINKRNANSSSKKKK